MLRSSLDWNREREKYESQLKELPFNKDLRNMLKNIDIMVDKLSKAEVNARRKYKSISEVDELKQANEAIDVFEKWLIMAAMLR